MTEQELLRNRVTRLGTVLRIVRPEQTVQAHHPEMRVASHGAYVSPQWTIALTKGEHDALHVGWRKIGAEFAPEPPDRLAWQSAILHYHVRWLTTAINDALDDLVHPVEAAA